VHVEPPLPAERDKPLSRCLDDDGEVLLTDVHPKEPENRRLACQHAAPLMCTVACPWQVPVVRNKWRLCFIDVEMEVCSPGTVMMPELSSPLCRPWSCGDHA